MNWNSRVVCVSMALTVIGPLGLGCAQSQQPAAWELGQRQLEARGPGALFTSIEAAAVDALTYAHLQARVARFTESTELVRGGTIYATPGGYSYDGIHVANPLSPHRIWYTLKPQDVARFHTYGRYGRGSAFRAPGPDERPTREERRSVSRIDPLHRPIYILHPSLTIREYRGEHYEFREVAHLRHWTPAECLLAEGLRGLSDNSC